MNDQLQKQEQPNHNSLQVSHKETVLIVTLNLITLFSSVTSCILSLTSPLCPLPPRRGCARPVLLYMELWGVPRRSQRLFDADGAVLQQPVGAELEECLRPDLLVLYLHPPSWSENMHVHTECMHAHTHTEIFRVLLMLHWNNTGSTSSPDSQYSPLVRSSLLGSVRLPQSSATCMSWGGAHYRTFDRRHFHFQGGCTYLLASSTDGTWAVYISTVCDGRGECSKVWKHHRTCPSSFLEKGTFVFQTKNGTTVLMWGYACVCGPLFLGFEDDAGSRFGVSSTQELNTEQQPRSKRRPCVPKW